jgi:hypothetical protein
MLGERVNPIQARYPCATARNQAFSYGGIVMLPIFRVKVGHLDAENW